MNPLAFFQNTLYFTYMSSPSLAFLFLYLNVTCIFYVSSIKSYSLLNSVSLKDEQNTCSFCHLKVIKIQFQILVGSGFLEICPELNLTAKTTKVCQWGNKQDENNKDDQNCNMLEGGQNESAQGPRLKNTKIEQIMKATNLTNLNYKNLDGGQNERDVQTDVINNK